MQIKIFHVAKRDDGLRLDRWFYRNLPNIPFIVVAKLVRTMGLPKPIQLRR